jgi:hypothetical protein
MIVVRHGLMTVGQPFSGKSASLKVLAGALTDLCERGEVIWRLIRSSGYGDLWHSARTPQ